MVTSPPVDRDDFQIAIICALPLEAECVQATFDQLWDKKYGKANGDYNAYTFGVISEHNVVLAHMPEMGKVSAATVAAGLRSSFKRIRAAFVVGICGAAPFRPDDQSEIILGDVVISESLVQYDLGRQYHSTFQSKINAESSPSRPGSEIRSLLLLRWKTQEDGIISQTHSSSKVSVIKYADSHKNKRWQYFAAATAASCLKALLNDWGLVDQVTSRDSDRSTEGEYHSPSCPWCL